MRFTYYTIIGKDINLLAGHVRNIKDYAGFNKLKCEKEFIIIVYKNKKIDPKITRAILQYCRKEKLKIHIYEEPTNIFIENLYACWNLGYKQAKDGYIFRGGSDQVFSKDSFLHLYEAAESLRKKGIKKFVLQANTIENQGRLKNEGDSRHFLLDLGSTFEGFDYKIFEAFIKKINKGMRKKIIDIDDALKFWGKPTKLTTSLGIINRVDGCSWLMTKNDWKKYGPLPIIENNITGDVIIHDRLQKAEYVEYIVRDCITYHFVKGESWGNQNELKINLLRKILRKLQI